MLKGRVFSTSLCPGEKVNYTTGSFISITSLDSYLIKIRMAYVTRPQYGVPVYEAPSTAPAGSQEPAHHNQNQKHDPIPGSSGASSPKPSHYHPDNTKIKAHDVQQHSYNPYRGYPELYRQDQAGSPQLRDHQEPKKVYSVEEHTHPSKEYYSPPGVGCQQSFSRPRLQQLSMSRLPFEMRFAQSYKEPKIPFPRSFSNEDYPQTSLGLQHGGQGYDGSFSVESKDGSGTSQICTNIVGSDGSGTSIPVRTEAKFKKPGEPLSAMSLYFIWKIAFMVHRPVKQIIRLVETQTLYS